MSEVPIPSDWDGVSWQCLTVEWPFSDDWTAIFTGLLTWPIRGRFWDGDTGTITDAQEIGRQIYVRNDYGVFNMGCFEDIALKLDCICNAIIAGSLSKGSSTSGLFASPTSDFVDSGSDYPDGYGSREEYSSDKCNLAQFVLNSWHDDFDKLKTINVAGQAASALAGLLVLTLATPIPFDDILLLISPILGLAAAGIATFVTAVEELQDRLDAIDICDLYSASTVTQAVENVETWIADGTYSQQVLTVALGQYLIGTDAVNPLFAGKSDLINYDELPVGDCSACSYADECWELFTTPAANDGVIVDSGPIAGGWFYDVEFELTTSPPCPNDVYRMSFAIPASCVFQVQTVSVIDGSWNQYCCNAGCSPPNSGTDVWGYYTPESGSATAATDPGDFQDINIEALVVYSATAVTLRFEVTPPVEP